MSLDGICMLLREMRDTGPITRREAAAVLDVPPGTVWHWLAKLRAMGIIRPCEEPMPGKPIRYELAPRDFPAGPPYRRNGKREARTVQIPIILSADFV